MTTRGPGAWTSALEEDEGNGDGYGKDDDYHDEDNENGRYKNEKLSAVTVTTRGPGALLLHHKSSPTMLHHQHYLHQDITTNIYVRFP